jgi:hypothetical protein
MANRSFIKREHRVVAALEIKPQQVQISSLEISGHAKRDVAAITSLPLQHSHGAQPITGQEVRHKMDMASRVKHFQDKFAGRQPQIKVSAQPIHHPHDPPRTGRQPTKLGELAEPKPPSGPFFKIGE